MDRPDHIKIGGAQWLYKYDLRDGSKAGGVWEYIMHGPDGKDYKNKSIFRK
jgi:hypothetical protein